MPFNPLSFLFEVPSRLNLPIEKHTDFAIVSIVGVVGITAHCNFLMLFWFFDVDFMVYFNIVSIITFIFIFYFNRNTVNISSFLVTLGNVEIILHGSTSVLMLGWESNFHLYILLPMLIAFLVGKINSFASYFINISAIFSYIFLVVYVRYNLPIATISETGMFVFQVLNVVSVASIIILITFYYSYIASQSSQKLISSNKELQKQKENAMSFNNELAQQTEELQIQSEQLEHSNKHTTDSIRYALRIQEAVLPSAADLDNLFGEKHAMVFFSPKDIVSGDFYWCKEKDGQKIIAVADCTGHGVPGAMLTMIGESILNNIILEKGITEPALILDALQVYFTTLFTGSVHNIQDGMDVCISKINYETKKLHFAGARNPLTYIQNGQMETIQGDKMSIGNSKIKSKSFDKFTSHQIDISVPTTIYMYTDGFQDQFGGNENRKFYSKNLRELFLKIHDIPISKQRTRLRMTFMEWCDFTKQTDDVTIVGIQIDTNQKQQVRQEIESERLINEIVEESKH